MERRLPGKQGISFTPYPQLPWVNSNLSLSTDRLESSSGSRLLVTSFFIAGC
uniref:Uncharacterized protein n=1 Tax=Arundo donax TaxID=35708 RepID=A0A0A9BFS4_ARUDO